MTRKTAVRRKYGWGKYAAAFAALFIGAFIWITRTDTARINYRFPAFMEPSPTSYKLRPTTTIVPLAAGPVTYTISHPQTSGPTIMDVHFNPLSVLKGQTLTLTVRVRDSVPVTSVTGVLTSDSQQSSHAFTQVKKQNSETYWSTDILVQDTLWKTYNVSITAQNSQAATTITVAPRS